MKKFYLLLSYMLFVGVFVCGCSEEEEKKDNDPETEIKLTDGTPDKQEIFADETSTGDKGISFASPGPWRAVVEEVTATRAAKQADWVLLSQYSGDKAGNYTITLTLTPNFSGKERRAVIRIICGDTEITITIVQKGVNESGAAPKMIKEIVYTEELGKDAELSWGRPKTETMSYFYDERGRVAKIIRNRREREASTEEVSVYTFDYDVVGEITITEKSADDITRILAKLDQSGRVVKLQDLDTYHGEADAYQFGYNETGQLAKMAYIGGTADGNWNKFGYTDGLLNKITEWWDNEESVDEIPVDELYPHRYSANMTNIDLNSVEWFGDECINFLYGMRLLGVGSKCLMEISMIYGERDEVARPQISYSQPNQTIHEEHKTIREPESGYQKLTYEFDAGKKYVTKFHSYQPYEIVRVTYDIVVGSEWVDPGHPDRGYKAEIQNWKEIPLGEDRNTYTYTVKYQD